MSSEISFDKFYSLEEYTKIAQAGYRYELVEGKLEEMSPTGPKHGIVAGLLQIYLGAYVLENKLGRTFIAEAGFNLTPTLERKTVLAPDVSFVRAERLASLIKDDEGFMVGPPDLAVEVVSPSETRPKVRTKIRKYQKYGTALIWVIWPERKIVEVYHLGSDLPLTLTAEDELNGGEIVPGFKLLINQLFS